MARIKAVASTQAGLYVKIGYYFTRLRLQGDSIRAEPGHPPSRGPR